jgi:hypothetical protein
MTDLWHVLVITLLSGPAAGDQSLILYPSAEACRAATITVSDSIAGAYDVKMECRATALLSNSPRPKKRP